MGVYHAAGKKATEKCVAGKKRGKLTERKKGGEGMNKRRIIPVLTPEGVPGLGSVIHTDPQGSYTGRPENVYEVPVQDADDL